MQDKKSFGRYIADKRKEANLTQEELAKRLYGNEESLILI